MEIKHKNPSTQYDLIQCFTYIKEEVTKIFSSIPEDEFFNLKRNGWSPAENLIHMTLNSNFLGITWKIPRFLLNILYGKSTERLSFLKWKALYLQKSLTQQSSGIFTPIIIEHNSQKEKRKNEILKNWETSFTHLTNELEKMNPEKFLLHRLPHPIFGKVSIQEICFLHILHIQHHCSKVESKIHQSAVLS
jgi:hypothetical protein